MNDTDRAAGALIGLLARFGDAQLGDVRSRSAAAAMQAAAGGALGNLAASAGIDGGGASLMPGSTGNVAGLLQFCIQNNYLGGVRRRVVGETR